MQGNHASGTISPDKMTSGPSENGPNGHVKQLYSNTKNIENDTDSFSSGHSTGSTQTQQRPGSTCVTINIQIQSQGSTITPPSRKLTE